MERLKLFIPLFVFIVLVGFLYRGLSLDPNHVPSALIGKSVPEFSLPSLTEESSIDQSDLIGQPYLLNVWATWCPTCIYEHPYLMTLAENGVKIIGLNYKDEKDKALEWLERLGDPYDLIIEDTEGFLAVNLGVYGAPETFIIDGEGKIVHRHAGEVNERVWSATLAPIYSAL